MIMSKRFIQYLMGITVFRFCKGYRWLNFKFITYMDVALSGEEYVTLSSNI